MKNILIPVERNPEENTIIPEAVDLAKKFNSKITLLTVDNTREILAEINNRRLIDDIRMVRIVGEHGLVEEENLPGSTEKNNMNHNKKNYNIENIKNKYIKEGKPNYINFIEAVEKLYQRKDIETNTIIAEGDPASAILDEVENGNYDLVIMKTHTMRKRKRFMLGSVTNKVVHHIKIPILVIR